MKFLITAYPRSGTLYTSTLLSLMGIDAPHEAVGKNGSVSWLHIASGPWLTQIKKHSFDKIIHQVRNPLDVISSAQTLKDYSLGYMIPHIQKVIYDSRLKLLMFTYLEWNRIIENKACYRFKIEEIEKVVPELCRILEINFNDFPKLQTNINTRRAEYNKLTWEDLYECDKNLADDIKLLALKYGYDV